MSRIVCKLACTFLFAACSEDLGLDDHLFRCSSDEDCREDLRCHPFERLCLPADHDAGSRQNDAGPQIMDAGPTCDDPLPAPYDPCQIAGKTSSTTLSSWWLCTDLSASQIETTSIARRATIEDLSIGATRNTLTYDVTLVQYPRVNRISTALFRGDLADLDRLVCGRTSTTAACTPGWRITDVEPIPNDRSSWAVVLVPWRNEVGWWWLTSTTAATLQNALDRSTVRLVDLEPARANSSGFLVVTVGNVGSFQRESRFEVNVPKSALATIARRGEVIASLEPEDEDGTRFSVILERCASCKGEALIDLDAAAIDRHARTHGLRVQKVAGYGPSDERRFAAVLAEDLRPPATVARDLLRAANAARYGFVLGNDSAALAALNDRGLFPAGVLPAPLIADYVRREVAARRASLNDVLPQYSQNGAECAVASSTATETLETAVNKALRGDPRRMQALIDHFGAATLDAFARENGLDSTHFSSCGESTSTLADLTKLHTLTSSIALPAPEAFKTRFEAEARAQAIQENIDPAAFLALIKVAAIEDRRRSSPGGCPREDAASIFGRIELPLCFLGSLIQTRYAFGAFLDDAQDPRIDAATDALLDFVLGLSARAYAACNR